MSSSGGKPQGVYVITDADLKGSVGGTFVIQPGPVLRATGFAQTTRGVSGGKPQAVYVVNETEANRRGVIGGNPMPIVDMTSSGRGVDGPHIAIPVYIVSGSEYIGPVSPTPPTPPTNILGYYRSFNWSGDITADPLAAKGSTWTKLLGDVDVGAFGAQPDQAIGAYSLVSYDRVTGLSTNQSVYFVDGYGTSDAGLMGVALRVAAPGNGYAFMTANTAWELVRFDSGVATILDSGSGISQNQGKVGELHALGSILLCVYDGVTIGGAIDVTYTSGTIGIAGLGNTNDTSIWGMWGGDVGVNVVAGVGRMRNVEDFTISTACNPTVEHRIAGGSSLIWVHDVNETHSFEIDFYIARRVSAIHVLCEEGDDGKSNWSNVTVEGKMLIGDSYTVLASGLSQSVVGNGYRIYELGASYDFRYLKMTIGATEDASNYILTSEVQAYSYGADLTP